MDDHQVNNQIDIVDMDAHTLLIRLIALFDLLRGISVLIFLRKFHEATELWSLGTKEKPLRYYLSG